MDHRASKLPTWSLSKSSCCAHPVNNAKENNKDNKYKGIRIFFFNANFANLTNSENFKEKFVKLVEFALAPQGMNLDSIVITVLLSSRYRSLLVVERDALLAGETVEDLVLADAVAHGGGRRVVIVVVGGSYRGGGFLGGCRLAWLDLGN